MADGRISYKQKTTDGDDEEDGAPSSKKKRRAVVRVERPRTVAQHLKGADLTEIQEVCKIQHIILNLKILMFEQKLLCISVIGQRNDSATFPLTQDVI